MAEEAAKAMEPNVDLLEWTKRDKRRLLHAVYRPVTLSVAMSEWGFIICVLTQSLGWVQVKVFANVLFVWFIVGVLECCGPRILLASLILKVEKLDRCMSSWDSVI
uniref:Uncharacterized protein n=1 Tax=Salix viminalis TaxID=40686 RepID=A0A6N2KSK7_SALVM